MNTAHVVRKIPTLVQHSDRFVMSSLETVVIRQPDE